MAISRWKPVNTESARRLRVHIEVENFSNKKYPFIFNNKEKGSIPASAPSKIKGLRAKANANPCLFLVRYFGVAPQFT